MHDGWLLMEAGPNDDRMPFSARFESLGRRLPPEHVRTDELMASTRHHTHIDLERLTGIHERRFAGPDEDSLTLAVGAARDCLDHSRYRPDELDVVIHCGITKYQEHLTQVLEPTMSQAVARAIGASHAMTFDISNACAGMLTGTFLLNNWIRRGTIRCGLIVSGEYISQLAQNAAAHVRNILSRELASLTLGDAGVAAILERAPEGDGGISAAGFTTLSEHSRLCLAYPARHEPGARMFTRSREIHRVAIANLTPLLHEALEAAGLDITDVDYVIPHQTSARAIRKGMAEVEEELGGSPRHPAVVTVDRFGNTASTTHFVALYEYLEHREFRRGDRIALIALASGLEIGVVIFTVDDLVDRYGNNN
jgi:3-oxoacyl-[acyl-carrier-protein] synthase-3